MGCFGGCLGADFTGRFSSENIWMTSLVAAPSIPERKMPWIEGVVVEESVVKKYIMLQLLQHTFAVLSTL